MSAFVHLDERIAWIASVQRGRVSTTQLRAAGVGAGAIDYRARVGRLHRVHRGVFAVGHPVDGPLSRETAALLACGEGALLSHRSAAALWGFLSTPDCAPIDVTTPGRNARHPGITVHRSRTLSRNETRRRAGLPLTEPCRTLLDLASTEPSATVERAVAEATVRRLVTEAALTAAVDRAARRHGVKTLRAILDGGAKLTRSEAERRFLTLIRRAGLPAPEVNVRLAGFEVDFLWRAQRLAVEIDGYAFHSTRAAFERDRRKEAALADHGVVLRRFGWRQLADEPERLLVTLTRALIVGAPSTRAA